MRTTNFDADQQLRIIAGSVMSGAASSAAESVLELTNRSGGTVNDGDVVVVDTANDASFTTTTTPNIATVTIGVAQDTIHNGSNGRILTSGYAPRVNVNGSNATRGHWLFASQVAKSARADATRDPSAFGQVLSSGTTPPAVINPPNTRASMLVHGSNTYTGAVTLTTPDNSVAITSPSAGTLAFMATGGAGAGTPPAAARYVRRTGDYTTTSATFTDLDSTNMALTITTGARRVLLLFSGTAYANNNGATFAFDFLVDGARVGGDFGILSINQHATANESYPVSMHYLTDTLSAWSHTFKVQWRVANAAHTATVAGAATGGAWAVFSVQEVT